MQTHIGHMLAKMHACTHTFKKKKKIHMIKIPQKGASHMEIQSDTPATAPRINLFLPSSVHTAY